jgi:hypothetical protein
MIAGEEWHMTEIHWDGTVAFATLEGLLTVPCALTATAWYWYVCPAFTERSTQLVPSITSRLIFSYCLPGSRRYMSYPLIASTGDLLAGTLASHESLTLGALNGDAVLRSEPRGVLLALFAWADARAFAAPRQSWFSWLSLPCERPVIRTTTPKHT